MRGRTREREWGNAGKRRNTEEDAGRGGGRSLPVRDGHRGRSKPVSAAPPMPNSPQFGSLALLGRCLRCRSLHCRCGVRETCSKGGMRVDLRIAMSPFAYPNSGNSLLCGRQRSARLSHRPRGELGASLVPNVEAIQERTKRGGSSLSQMEQARSRSVDAGYAGR